MDDENAIPFTLNQTKDNGSLQFKVGIAILSRRSLDRIKKDAVFAGFLDYERDQLETNPYHGNLLLKKDIDPRKKTSLRFKLAHAAKVKLREETQQSP
ncbi:MAG: hypothetical protein JW741_25130 [Sedimentisphaerales bacterium]|nr:hypothetical protein [Sedimentisphaerales bacterium]